MKIILTTITAGLLLAACNAPENTAPAQAPTPTAPQTGSTDTTQNKKPDVSVVISISARQLSVLRGADTIQKWPVAVGKDKYPTPTGDFKFHQIDFNPDWTPPEGDWAKNKKPEEPGSKNNPMGRARIIYQSPYSVHGTKDLASLGDAESHGSVRMANNHVIEFAKLMMKESGTEKDEAWYAKVLADSTKMVSVKLRDSIPLVNKQ